MLAVIQSLWELVVGRLCYLWTGYLGREISIESVLKAWTKTLILRCWSEANMQEWTIYFRCFSHTQKPWTTHVLVIFPSYSSSYLTVLCVYPCSGSDFSPTRCASGSERAEWQEGNGPRFFMPLTWSDRDCCTARAVGVGQSVVMCAHMFFVCGCVFRCVAGECSGTHQPVIAHNCIHLWERQRWTLVRSVTRTVTSLLPQD